MIRELQFSRPSSLAAIRENPDADDLVGSFSASTFWTVSAGGSGSSSRIFNNIVSSLLDTSSGMPLATAASPLKLTDFGDAANGTGFSPQSCRSIVEFLQRVQPPLSQAGLAAKLLRELSLLPEQQNRNLRKMLTLKRSRFSVKGEDFEQVLSDWLANVPREASFAKLPRVRKSTRTPPISVWLEGSTKAAAWDEEFDKFVEFLASVVEGFLPWTLRACGRLCQFASDASKQIDWASAATSFESRSSEESSAGEEQNA